MLIALAVAIVLIVAYAHSRDGMLATATLLVNVILAGILTFNFWEPLADRLDVLFAATILAGYEDAFVLTVLFGVFLILLRMAATKLLHEPADVPGYFQQAGSAVLGLLTGYLVAGFLVCVLETLPWHENFLDFAPRNQDESSLRRYFPPDRVWLALLRYAGALPLASLEEKEDAENLYDRFFTFDGDGTFELRFLRYRRHGDRRDALKYDGELDAELRKQKPR